jgi:hypothetical protein
MIGCGEFLRQIHKRKSLSQRAHIVSTRKYYILSKSVFRLVADGELALTQNGSLVVERNRRGRLSMPEYCGLVGC